MEPSPGPGRAYGARGAGLLDTLRGALRGALREALGGPLPAARAWARMIPSWARPPDPGRTDWREAAVLILLHPLDSGLGFPLLLRSDSLPQHRGQIALPGGAREGGESLEGTALRETEEEIGLSRASIEILGRLSPLRIDRSGFSVLPFVGWTAPQPEYRLEVAEVAELIEAPLDCILGPGSEAEIAAEDGPRSVPCFRVSGHVVWGATAMILAELAALLSQAAIDRLPGIRT